MFSLDLELVQRHSCCEDVPAVVLSVLSQIRDKKAHSIYLI